MFRTKQIDIYFTAQGGGVSDAAPGRPAVDAGGGARDDGLRADVDHVPAGAEPGQDGQGVQSLNSYLHVRRNRGMWEVSRAARDNILGEHGVRKLNVLRHAP